MRRTTQFSRIPCLHDVALPVPAAPLPAARCWPCPAALLIPPRCPAALLLPPRCPATCPPSWLWPHEGVRGGSSCRRGRRGRRRRLARGGPADPTTAVPPHERPHPPPPRWPPRAAVSWRLPGFSRPPFRSGSPRPRRGAFPAPPDRAPCPTRRPSPPPARPPAPPLSPVTWRCRSPPPPFPPPRPPLARTKINLLLPLAGRRSRLARCHGRRAFPFPPRWVWSRGRPRHCSGGSAGGGRGGGAAALMAAME